MAGAAFLWRVWRHRRVRIVAGNTGSPGIMAIGINLREAGRPRRIVSVTEWTKGTLARGWRYMIRGRFHVSRLCSVANLAGYGPVAGFVMYFGNVRMAHGASFMSRIICRFGRILF